jgi:hypothetical protein
MKKCILITGLLVFCFHWSYGADPVNETLAQLRKLRVSPDWGKETLVDSRQTSESNVEELALQSIGHLLTYSQEDPLSELLWYKTPHRSVRVLIVAAFRCRLTNGDHQLPDFAHFCQRLERGEAEARLQEIAFVEANLLSFTALMLNLTANLDWCEELHRSYSAMNEKLLKAR